MKNEKSSKKSPIFTTLIIFFFSLIQQFITQRARADRGSYFRNYIHMTHANMK